jgi:hypothetical protein
MENSIVQATREQRDAIVSLIDRASETFGGDVPRAHSWAAYIAALNAARRNLEEALRIVEDADRT